MRGVAAAVAAGLLLGCASAGPAEGPLPQPPPSFIDKWDPLEPMNRGIWRFNAGFDKYVWLPALEAWRLVLPRPVRTGISNVLSNVGEVTVLANSILQLDAQKTAGTIWRLVINTTVGVGGVWDPASRVGLPGYDEDFGQTLAHYGVGPGPYLVLPFLGPSSGRDATGLAADSALMSTLQAQLIGSFLWNHFYLYAIPVMQLRDDNPFRYGELGPFEYDLIRFLYLEYRQAVGQL